VTKTSKEKCKNPKSIGATPSMIRDGK